MTPEDEKFVKKIAFKIYKICCPKGDSMITLEDLFQEGIIGLLKAKQNFNEEEGVPFNAYASIRISGEIMDAIRRSPAIKLPQAKYGRIKKFNLAKKTLLDKGIQPDHKTIACELGWDDKTVLETESLASRVMIPVDMDYTKNRQIHLSSTHTGEKEVMNKDLAQTIKQCLERIQDVKARIIFIKRDLEENSLDGKKIEKHLGSLETGRTLKSLSISFNISIETVRQKYIKAKKSMKSCLEENGWALT